MVKQESEENNEKRNDTKVRPNINHVIITVYVESDSISHHLTNKINPKTISRKPHHPTARTRICDRRAHLLAYAQELRTAVNAQQVQQPKSGSKPKQKVSEKRFTTPVRLRRPGSRWRRYQRIVPEVDISCNSKWNSGMNKKSRGSKTSSNLLRKLRHLLRALWHCNKGSKVDDGKQHRVA